ncbi:NAD(P)-binding protein [Trichodelitschia bisporula]|uniref:NAD(P)-binding protein n=1 Tax=Trichodelitschia bisporula TaxID=703511 RepID=A0A6G1HRP9_9PEZI|nr:NAD(P)-binding protein [Trichodelitschia bisporula]
MFSSSSPKSGNEVFTLDKIFDVKGKVALITGAGSGIGLMATQALAVNGAKVYIVGRTSEKLETVAQTYGKNISGQIIPLTADVTSKSDITRLYEEISSREKCLCILMNNAGISSSSFETSASSAQEMKKNLFEPAEAKPEDWTSVYNTNVASVYFMSTAFMPLLAAATEMHPGFSGTIINTTSISGLVKSPQHHFSYNASKAAAIHLTRMLANTVAENGIKVRVNSIAPGVFPSEMTAGESGEDQKSFIPREKYEDKVPAARPGNDRDMAGAVLFTVCNQYLNGQTIVVDGGYTLAAGL